MDTVILVPETVLLGLTGSMWIMLVEFLIIMGLACTIFTLIFYAGPTFGYIKARWEKKPTVALVIQNHDATIKSMDYFAGIFKNRLGLTWLQSKWENINFGVCSLEIVADWAGWTMEAKKNVALKQFIDDWNSAAETDPVKKKITNVDTLYDAFDNTNPDDEVRIRAFCHVPVYELQNYWPKELKASDLTGHLEAMKEVDRERAKEPKAQIIQVILGVIIGLALGAGAAMMLLK